MVVEYTRGSAIDEVKGSNFKAYSWVKLKDTLVLYNLWEVVKNNSEQSFDEIYGLLKLYYSMKTERSKASISKYEDRIEITTKSIIFPNILIIKNR